MGLLIGGWIVAATVCASLATVLLLIWVQDRRTLSYPILAIAALAASGLAVAEIRMAGATSIAAYLAGFKLSNYCVAVLLIGLAWFIVTYSGTRQRLLAWFTTFVWLIGTVLNAIRPTGLALAEISGLETMTTLWGESYTVAIARVDASKLFADTGAVAVMLLAFQACLSLWRADAKRRAVLLATIGLFLGFALVHTTLVDLGYLASPYMISYLFVGIVVVTSYELALRVASEASLSERVRLDEQRWRTLLEEVELLVARIRIDGVIEYANPCFCRVSGYTAGELTGSDIRALLPETDRQSLFRQLDAGLRGRHDSGIETSLTTKTGDLRTIVWSRVFFQQTGSDVPEVLSVGADITAQRQAEDDRDQALKAIAALKSQLEEENLYLKEQIKIEIEGDFAEIVGETEALRYVLFRTEQVAATDTSVLIQGETGVGKELVARAVHERSRRSKAPFVRVNCAALPPNLVESELFGHVAGAFTDAKEKRIGRFELADGGTLFLDEVSELPLELQPKLLRVLQDGQFDPVGSSETYKARRTADRRHQPESQGADRFGQVSRGSLLSPERLPDHGPSVARPCGRYPATGRVLPAPDQRQGGKSHRGGPRGRVALPAGLFLARQRTAAAEHSGGSGRAVGGSSPATADALRDSDPRKDRESTTVLESLADAERKHIRKALETTHGQVAGRGGAAEILDLHPNTLRSRMKKLGLGAK